MRLLLDTHLLLWAMEDSPRLTPAVRNFIAGTGEVYVSAATAWEIAIKCAAGKLKAPGNIEEALRESRFAPLAISVRHALEAGALPRYHADPFDRMLIAQARCEGLQLLTSDDRLMQYGPAVLHCRDVR